MEVIESQSAPLWCGLCTFQETSWTVQIDFKAHNLSSQERFGKEREKESHN